MKGCNLDHATNFVFSGRKYGLCLKKYNFFGCLVRLIFKNLKLKKVYV